MRKLLTFVVVHILVVALVHAAVNRSVLVLGSAGLIGAVLAEELEAQGYTVYGADIQRGKDSHHVLDLRQPGAMDVFNDKGIEFVFFLACDVGGSK